MKRSYLAALAVAFLLFATIAGAHMITPAPGATASPLVASGARKAQPATVARAPEPVPTPQTAAIARSPVPLRLSPRPAIKRAEGETASAQVAASDASQTNLQNESFAKAAIEQDGYKSVRGITKGPNGSWRATAMRGKTEVILRVDASGNVSAQ